MRLVQIALTALTLLATSTVASAQEEPRLAAVISYADWCASCRVLEPKVDEARAGARFEGVEFIRLDYTARDAGSYFAQANNTAIADAIRNHFNNRVRTGMLLLVDIDDGTVVGEIRRDASVQDITYQIWSAAADA